MLCGLIYFGSRGLKDFDPALRGFALTTVLGAFALGYRLFTWLQRPPSRVYFNRGLKLFWRYLIYCLRVVVKNWGLKHSLKNVVITVGLCTYVYPGDVPLHLLLRFLWFLDGYILMWILLILFIM